MNDGAGESNKCHPNETGPPGPGALARAARARLHRGRRDERLQPVCEHAIDHTEPKNVASPFSGPRFAFQGR